MKKSRRHALLIAVTATLAIVISPQAVAFIDDLTVDPPSPDCDSEVTIAVQGHFPDACFHVNGIETVTLDNNIWFVINVTEYTGPGGCALIIVPYEAEQSLGTLPEGDYVLAAEELVYPTQTGDSHSIPFSVCCTPAPGPVNGLRLEKTQIEGRLRFTWIDVAGANEYTLYMEDDPGGDFIESIGSATSGVTGIDLLPPGGTVGEPQFFLVTAKNGCAEGPKRNPPP